ncbi:hypothetical protein A374_00560 [Fictibacillus macauensis ZFHKF-1]|uniref:Peptidase S54 rhomboid domain-containing protein n=1 Tax=Fictibacillus macauensis ZFHKF-1 TaxID=1196324 RepID=I8UKK9_9BACL|nr:rhomboid family intramembrane serine protease [Fictibacillus macauensis]EIT87420.1 hypothetical protein A374_00560 [Fictibacillus macauensis ZFHKF-1]
MFAREESFKEFLKRYPLVSAILAIQLIVYVLMTFTPLEVELSTTFIGYNEAISQGEYWRLITPLITHIEFPHLLFNSFSLFIFGPLLERLLGKGLFIISYFGSGILSHLLLLYLLPENYAYLGASSAIFGLYGVYTYLLFFKKHILGTEGRQLLLPLIVIGLILSFVSLDGSEGIVYGHLFGFLGGVVLAPFTTFRLR